MNEYIEFLKNRRGPAGDLYLTSSHAEHLIRWLEVYVKDAKQMEESIAELQKLLKINIRKNSETE